LDNHHKATGKAKSQEKRTKKQESAIETQRLLDALRLLEE
jgi:hypothetical protein